jgi:hypothetical protein
MRYGPKIDASDICDLEADRLAENDLAIEEHKEMIAECLVSDFQEFSNVIEYVLDDPDLENALFEIGRKTQLKPTRNEQDFQKIGKAVCSLMDDIVTGMVEEKYDTLKKVYNYDDEI